MSLRKVTACTTWRPTITQHGMTQLYNVNAKWYMDSDATISVTGDLTNLANRRRSNVKVQAFNDSKPSAATVAGDHGPIRDVHHIHGAQNLISIGMMLDVTTAGLFSTPKHSYLVSGLQIGQEVTPGTFSVSATPSARATKVATRGLMVMKSMVNCSPHCFPKGHATRGRTCRFSLVPSAGQ